MVVPFERFAHHQIRPPSALPLDAIGCSFLSRSRSAQRASTLSSIRSRRACADAVDIRNTSSPHWRGWLKPESRCLVPANSFSE
jgi:hypothetical protein